MSDRRAANESHLAALPLPIVEFDGDDARQAGKIRAELTRACMLIGPYDMLIAGQARARNLTLVTHNTREFRQVSDLSIEDWEG
jgi:tRNA(fMet)-specific endonuclease VapC